MAEADGEVAGFEERGDHQGGVHVTGEHRAVAEPLEFLRGVQGGQRTGADADHQDAAGPADGFAERGEHVEVEPGGGLLGGPGVGPADLADQLGRGVLGAEVAGEVEVGAVVGAQAFGLGGAGEPELGVAAQFEAAAEAVHGGLGGAGGAGEFGDGPLGGETRVGAHQVGDAAFGGRQLVAAVTDAGEQVVGHGADSSDAGARHWRRSA